MESSCPAAGYADPANKQYPCHLKTACLQSALLAADAGATPEVMSQLAKFASFWGIESEVTDAVAKVASTKQSASSDELADADFALVADHAGKKIRKFAAYDIESVGAAARAFYTQRASFPFDWRKTASERLLDMAAKHGTIFPAYMHEYFLKAACVASFNEDSVDAGLVHRMNLTHKRDDDAMNALGSMLNKVATAPHDFDTSSTAAVLSAVDEFDRHLKLAQHYGTDRLPLPEEMLVVKRQTKVASTPVRLINGRVIDASQLTKEALATVDEALADMTLAKLAQVLPTLPKPDADLLMRMSPKIAADLGALTDDNFSAATAPAAAAPATPAAPPMPAPAPAPAAPAGGMVDPMAGAGQNKMTTVASGAAASNFAANGSNMPTNSNEQIAMNAATNAGAGASLGTQHAPLQ